MENKVVRKIDELGRIVLPQDFRNALSWNTETKIAIIRQGNQLILQPDKDTCLFCGREQSLIQIKDKYICDRCILEAKEKDSI